jgi:indolepyruvate ferredoxin oxidoreductase, beta subunit
MNKSETMNILFCGTGGQGVLKSAEIMGWAAIFEGYHVKKSEVHGMAQRGGSVESHLRYGEKVFSPLIPKGKVDFLVSFHKDEHLRLKDFLKPEGKDLINYFEKGRHLKIYLNTFLLGALSRYLSIKEENWLKAIDLVFSHKNFSENKKVFLEGREAKDDLE